MNICLCLLLVMFFVSKLVCSFFVVGWPGVFCMLTFCSQKNAGAPMIYLHTFICCALVVMLM